MRLYLDAKSKNNVGYTPDWIKVSFEENGVLYDLVLDIQGTTDYNNTCLSCRCKGELIPWVLWNYETGDEINLYELAEEEVYSKFPDEKIAKIICDNEDFEIGIYPTGDDNFEKAKDDILSECNGLIEIYVDDHLYEKEFTFATELNLQGEIKVKKKIELTLSCFAPIIIIEIEVPDDRNDEEYIDELLDGMLVDEFKYNAEWDFVE